MRIGKDRQKQETQKPVDSVQLFCGGKWQDAKVFNRAQLTQDAKIDGPAIIAEDTATTVVDPGWSLRVRRKGLSDSRENRGSNGSLW